MLGTAASFDSPDASRLTIGGPLSLAGQANFSCMAKVGAFNALPLIVSNGLTLDDQRNRLNSLPPRFSVSDIRMVTIDGLRAGTVQLAIEQPLGGVSLVRWGVLESPSACIEISIADAEHGDIVAILADLDFSDTSNGIFLNNTIDNSQRPIAAYLSVTNIGSLVVRPAITEVTAQSPQAGGVPVAGGLLYRTAAASNAVTLVAPSAVATLTPPRSSTVDPTSTLAATSVSWS